MQHPVRTCIGCRGKAAKSDLLRIIWQGGPTADPKQTQAGRGAYLHRSVDCLELALKRRVLTRALRLAPGQGVDPERLRGAVVPYLDTSAEFAANPTSRNRAPVA